MTDHAGCPFCACGDPRPTCPRPPVSAETQLEVAILSRLKDAAEEHRKYPWSKPHAGLHLWQLGGRGNVELALYRLRKKGLAVYDKRTRAWRLR